METIKANKDVNKFAVEIDFRKPLALLEKINAKLDLLLKKKKKSKSKS